MIDFSRLDWNAAINPVTLGEVLGHFPGKLIGITAFSLLAVRLGIGRLPRNVTWRQMIGIGCLGGIGFTMSLFISNVAFTYACNLEQAKIGILAASLVSGFIGLAWLRFAGPVRGTRK